MKQKRELIRFQFDFPKEKIEKLEKMKNAFGVKTKKELLSNALVLLEWAFRETKKGNTIASIDQNSIHKELCMEILETLKPIEIKEST